MIDNKELPIGFTLELAMHPNVLSHFSTLPPAQQTAVIDGARLIQSRNEMRAYVEALFGQ